MTHFLKQITSALVRNNFFWKLLDLTLLRSSRFMDRERKAYLNGLVIEAIHSICPDLKVRNGVFKGMRYPEIASFGSTLFPKLLGSYEQELQPVWEKVLPKKYTEIIDVGCAEGYYAVGLALRFPFAMIYAYDREPRALDLCYKMAQINMVNDRVVLNYNCTSETLRDFMFRNKGLIVCDCEGCEKEIFTVDNVSSLRQCDLVIELHKLVDPEIPDYLFQLFKPTHEIVTIESVDDTLKAQH